MNKVLRVGKINKVLRVDKMNKVLVVANYSGEKLDRYLDGCRMVGLDPVPSDKLEDPDKYAGLLLTGGPDVTPALYLDEAALAATPKDLLKESLEIMDTEYDRITLELIDAFVNKGKAVFGICKGEQILNVYFGGTLLLDVPPHRMETGQWHGVKLEAESVMLGRLPQTFKINSYHHQAVGKLGSGLWASSFADDGIIESVESKTQNVFGVQWHPERMLHAENGSTLGLETFKIFAEMISR